VLLSAIIEIIKEIFTLGRGWTIALALVGGGLAAGAMFVTTADSPDKGYAVIVLFCLGAVLGAMAGLRLDKRAKASK